VKRRPFVDIAWALGKDYCGTEKKRRTGRPTKTNKLGKKKVHTAISLGNVKKVSLGEGGDEPVKSKCGLIRDVDKKTKRAEVQG